MRTLTSANVKRDYEACALPGCMMEISVRNRFMGRVRFVEIMHCFSRVLGGGAMLRIVLCMQGAKFRKNNFKYWNQRWQRIH